MPAFEAIQYQGKMGSGNILISVLTANATERDRVKAIFDWVGYGRGSGCFVTA